MEGIAMAVAPLISGALTQHVTWRWCFYINLPLGGFSLGVIILLFRNPKNQELAIVYGSAGTFSSRTQRYLPASGTAMGWNNIRLGQCANHSTSDPRRSIVQFFCVGTEIQEDECDSTHASLETALRHC
jgi:MFS family permease